MAKNSKDFTINGVKWTLWILNNSFRYMKDGKMVKKDLVPELLQEELAKLYSAAGERQDNSKSDEEEEIIIVESFNDRQDACLAVLRSAGVRIHVRQPSTYRQYNFFHDNGRFAGTPEQAIRRFKIVNRLGI